MRDTHMAVVRLRNGKVRLIHEARLQWLLACSLGGQTTQRRKRGHRWTSAEAKAAAAKSRGRRMPGGRYVGRKVKYAPRVDRKALRALYAKWERLGIRYRPRTGDWVLAEGGRVRVLSEKAALARLGHVGSRGYMPTEIVRSGMRQEPPRQ